MNYITAEELTSIAKLIELLENGVSPLGVDAKLFDSNGDILGYVRVSEGGIYAYHAEPE